MIPAAAALIIALAVGEAKGTARAESRAALAASNAARAKIGLLPRKEPAKAAPGVRGSARFRGGLSPTYLGEPGTLAGAPEHVPAFEAPPSRRVALSALGVTTDVTISMRFDPE